MRSRFPLYLVVSVLLAAVTFNPAHAEFGGGFLISVGETNDAPAGRISFSFADRGGVPTYWYTGSSANIVIGSSSSFPAFTQVIARIDLDGVYADREVIPSTGWRSISRTVSADKKKSTSVFALTLLDGENQAVFDVAGRQRDRIRFLFWSATTSEKTVRSAKMFQILVQKCTGLDDYAIQLQWARKRWPNAGEPGCSLWARTWCLERRYLAQGIVPIGTNDDPVVSCATLASFFDTGARWDTKSSDSANPGEAAQKYAVSLILPYGSSWKITLASGSGSFAFPPVNGRIFYLPTADAGTYNVQATDAAGKTMAMTWVISKEGKYDWQAASEGGAGNDSAL